LQGGLTAKTAKKITAKIEKLIPKKLLPLDFYKNPKSALELFLFTFWHLRSPLL
jgi:hypothetical protein